MQVSAACLVYLIALPISFYLQFKDFKVYKDDYMGIFIGVFADTYIIAFLSGILKLFVEFISDCSDGITTMKKSILSLKIKDGICYFGAIIVLYKAFSYYFNKEFEGLFGDMRKIIGGIYIVFILCPVIKAIKQVIINKKQRC